MNTNPIFLAEMSGTKKYYLYAVSNITNSSNTRITAYPTTEGTSISDNAYREPYNISMSIAVSELNTSKNCLDDGVEKKITTLEEFKQILFDWKENFTRLILQTRHTQYTNMIITAISWNDNNSTYGTFNPSITFSECRVAKVTTEVVGPFKEDTTNASYTQESFRGINNGSSLGTILLGTGVGLAGGAYYGAKIGAFFGHPLIGAGIGAVAGGLIGAVATFGSSVGWW